MKRGRARVRHKIFYVVRFGHPLVASHCDFDTEALNSGEGSDPLSTAFHHGDVTNPKEAALRQRSAEQAMGCSNRGREDFVAHHCLLPRTAHLVFFHSMKCNTFA